MAHLETLVNEVGGLRGAREAGESIDERYAKAQALDPLEYGVDPAIQRERVQADFARGYYQDRVSGFVGEHIEDILTEVGTDKLAKRYLNVTPVTTGNPDHDKVVGLHKKLISYTGLMQKIREGEVDKDVMDSVTELAVKDFETRINSDPLNKYLSDNIKKLGKIAAETRARSDPIGYINQETNRLGDEIKGILGDENARAQYTKDNLKALVAKDINGRLQAAEILAEISK